MPKASYSISIGRSPEVVFDYLDDFGNDQHWRANVVAMVPQGDEGSSLGIWGRQIERRKVPGRIIETEAELTDRTRPHRLAVRRASGPIRPEAIYELTPTASGTQLEFRVDVKLEGWAILMTPIVMLLLGLVVKPVLPADFGRLKRALENPSAT